MKWWSQTGQNLATFDNNYHQQMAISPDGSAIATLTNTTAKVYDQSGQCITTLQHNKYNDRSRLLQIAFKADNSTVVILSGDRTLSMWDTRNGEEIFFDKESGLPRRPIGCFTVSAHGTAIAITTQQSSIAQVWNKIDQSIIRLNHQSEITAIAITPDGSTIATGAYDGTAKLWNKSGECTITLLCHRDEPLGALAMTPDGKTIVTGLRNGTMMKIWDSAGNCEDTIHCYWPFTKIIITNDSALIATTHDEVFKIWDRHSGTCLMTCNSIDGDFINEDGSVILSKHYFHWQPHIALARTLDKSVMQNMSKLSFTQLTQLQELLSSLHKAQEGSPITLSKQQAAALLALPLPFQRNICRHFCIDIQSHLDTCSFVDLWNSLAGKSLPHDNDSEQTINIGETCPVGGRRDDLQKIICSYLEPEVTDFLQSSK